VALIPFNNIADASNIAIELMQQDVKLGMVELMDDVMMNALNIKNGLNYPVKPTLYLEFSGSKPQLDWQREVVLQKCARNQAAEFVFVTTKAEREKLFQIRKVALFSSTVLKPGSEVLTTDVCVPISNLAKCIVETKLDLENSKIIAPIVGHVGDGNFHLFVLIDPKNKKELEEAKRLNERLISRAIDMEGTCSGEHGIGVGKKEYLMEEFGTEAVALMRKIKRIIDPKNIMNPGKKIPGILGDEGVVVADGVVTHVTVPKRNHVKVDITWDDQKWKAKL